MTWAIWVETRALEGSWLQKNLLKRQTIDECSVERCWHQVDTIEQVSHVVASLCVWSLAQPLLLSRCSCRRSRRSHQRRRTSHVTQPLRRSATFLLVNLWWFSRPLLGSCLENKMGRKRTHSPQPHSQITITSACEENGQGLWQTAELSWLPRFPVAGKWFLVDVSFVIEELAESVTLRAPPDFLLGATTDESAECFLAEHSLPNLENCTVYPGHTSDKTGPIIVLDFSNPLEPQNSYTSKRDWYYMRFWVQHPENCTGGETSDGRCQGLVGERQWTLSLKMSEPSSLWEVVKGWEQLSVDKVAHSIHFLIFDGVQSQRFHGWKTVFLLLIKAPMKFLWMKSPQKLRLKPMRPATGLSPTTLKRLNLTLWRASLVSLNPRMVRALKAPRAMRRLQRVRKIPWWKIMRCIITEVTVTIQRQDGEAEKLKLVTPFALEKKRPNFHRPFSP